jgi:hypothetical protein
MRKRRRVHVLIFNGMLISISFCKIELTYMSRKDIENLVVCSSIVICGDTTFSRMEW